MDPELWDLLDICPVCGWPRPDACECPGGGDYNGEWSNQVRETPEVCFDCGLAPAGGDGFCTRCRSQRYADLHEDDLPDFDPADQAEDEWDEEQEDDWLEDIWPDETT